MTQLPKPTACIFDLDGTLVKHKNPKTIARLERYDTLIHILTKPFQKTQEVPTEMDLTVNVESNPLIHRIVHAIRILRGMGVDKVVEPYEGAIDILNYLKRKKMPMSISSNGHGEFYGHDVLKRYDMEKYFDSVIFRENVRHGKPSSEGLLRSILLLGLDEKKPQNIWYIGDQAKDMKAAIEANKQMPKNWQIVPVAFNATRSTAYMYLTRAARDVEGLTQKNSVKSFEHLQEKLENLLGK